MLYSAIKASHKAKYVLFDRWFSCPATIIRIKNDFNLNTIAMLKKSSKVKYNFDGERLDIKQIFARCKKRPGRSRFLLSVEIGLFCKAGNGEEIIIPAKIVCVRNRANRKDWLAMISTDTSLDENEIIRIYGKRWDIEVFFKTCKSMYPMRCFQSLWIISLPVCLNIFRLHLIANLPLDCAELEDLLCGKFKLFI